MPSNNCSAGMFRLLPPMVLQMLEQLHSMMNRRDCDVDDVESWRSRFSNEALCLINAASSTGRCNAIWYKAVFKGGIL